MKILSFLRRCISIDVPTVDVQACEKDIIKGIVKNYSSGNVSLKLGKYVTKSDMDKNMQELENYSFSSAVN